MSTLEIKAVAYKSVDRVERSVASVFVIWIYYSFMTKGSESTDEK